MKKTFKFMGAMSLFVSLSVQATTVSIWQPEPSQNLPANSWSTFAGGATSSRGIEEVRYYLNGLPYCTVKQAPFNCSYKSSNSGSYTLKMVARGYDGTSAEQSINFTVGSSTYTPTPTPPTTAIIPSVNIIAPASGSVFDPDFWTTITGTASNAGAVTYYANGGRICTVYKSPYNCSYKTPASGSVVIKAVAISSTGHQAEKSITLSVREVAAVIPSVNIIAPGNNTTFAPDFWTTLTGSASNAVKFEYFVNGVRLCTKTAAPFNCSYKTPASGSVSVKAVATSSSGHTAEKTINLIVSGGTTTPTPTPTPEPEPTPTPTPSPSGPQVPAGYTLYFNDEFDNNHNGEPNPAWWSYDVNYIRNNELQCYTDNRRENVRVENRNMEGYSNGYLVLELKKESYPCKQAQGRTFGYTSGAVTTRKKGWAEYLVDMPHGRYEVRAKIPSGRGTWPAIWLLGSSSLGSWPDSGEIDIMEAVGYDEAAGRYVLYSTLHRNSKFGWPNKWGTSGQGMHYLLSEPPSAKFHTWVMEWTPNSIEFFVDGVRVKKLLVAGDQYEERLGFFRSEFAGTDSALGWPYSRETPGHKWELILNLAWGGEWGGVKGIDDSIFANGKRVEMLVDYVRVYKKN